MAIQSPRTTWTDERLDDLSQTVRSGFTQSSEEHREMRQELRDGFARVDGRIDDLQRTLVAGMLGLAGTVVAAALTIIATLG
ncbi:MAG: hypothetical protein WBW62_05745 [Solirubrobacterales bacterium]